MTVSHPNFLDWVPSKDLGPNGGSVMLVFVTFAEYDSGKLKHVVSVADFMVVRD